MDHNLCYGELSSTSLVHRSTRKEVQTSCTNSGGRAHSLRQGLWLLESRRALNSWNWNLYILGVGFWGWVSVYDGDPQLAWPLGWANWESLLTLKPILKETNTAWFYRTSDCWPSSSYLHDMPSSIESLCSLIRDFGKSQNKCKWFII